MAAATLLFSFIIAMFVTMVLIPPLMHWAEQARLVDMPDVRKVHTIPIPRVGGIAMLAGTLPPMLMWLAVDRLMAGMLAGMVIIFLFGMWDDRRNLDYRLKFLGQLLAIAVVVGHGGLTIQALPFVGPEAVPAYVSVPLTVLFLLGITNAINLADGLDGLAGGTTLLIFSALAVLAYVAGDRGMLLVTLAVMGSILGFLRFNTHPARVFMGDSGSQVLGFTVGVLALQMSQRVDPSLSPSLPVLLLGLPILDTLFVMGQRLWDGRSPFKPDRNHIHHRLLALGFNHYQAVFIIYVVQSALVTGAYFLRHQPDAVILGVYGLFCLGVVAFFNHAARDGTRVRVLPRVSGPLLAGLARHPSLGRLPCLVAGSSIPLYLVLNATLMDAVPGDVAVLAGVMLLALAGTTLRHAHQPLVWLERALVYVSATMMVYLSHLNGSPLAFLEDAVHVYYTALALAVLAGFVTARNQRFQVTTLDFLVVFLAFTIPNLPGVEMVATELGEGVAELVVLFYGIELALQTSQRNGDGVRAVLLVVLLLLAAHGVPG